MPGKSLLPLSSKLSPDTLLSLAPEVGGQSLYRWEEHFLQLLQTAKRKQKNEKTSKRDLGWVSSPEHAQKASTSFLQQPPRPISVWAKPRTLLHSSLGLGLGTGSTGRWTLAKLKQSVEEGTFQQRQPDPDWQALFPVPDILFLLFLALPSLCCLFFSFLPFLLTFLSAVLPKNFKVKMVTKTSVLLSWEFPENYNSPTPYKASGMEESELCFFLVSWESCLLV